MCLACLCSFHFLYLSLQMRFFFPSFLDLSLPFLLLLPTYLKSWNLTVKYFGLSFGKLKKKLLTFLCKMKFCDHFQHVWSWCSQSDSAIPRTLKGLKGIGLCVLTAQNCQHSPNLNGPRYYWVTGKVLQPGEDWTPPSLAWGGALFNIEWA